MGFPSALDPRQTLSANSTRLRTFGGLWLEIGGAGALQGQPVQRHLLLLALAAEAGERGISRDRTIGLLWPESDDERGRRSLNQLRYTLRRELGGNDLVVGTQTLRLDPALCASDVAEFRTAIAAGDVDRAAALHTAPFLDGVFAAGSAELDQWVEESRAGFRRALETALASAARAAGESGPADWLSGGGVRWPTWTR